MGFLDYQKHESWLLLLHIIWSGGSKMLWSCNVLGSHAWPISRTCQIVAHWCNSWMTVAWLVDRRICMITARSCTSRQMGPIERKPFLGIHFIVYVFGASMCDVFTFEHVIVLSGVSQMDRMKWKLTTFGGQKRVALSRRIRACVPVCLRIWHALVLQCSRISCVANF